MWQINVIKTYIAFDRSLKYHYLIVLIILALSKKYFRGQSILYNTQNKVIGKLIWLK